MVAIAKSMQYLQRDLTAPSDMDAFEWRALAGEFVKLSDLTDGAAH